jgi:hypothetical protein
MTSLVLRSVASSEFPVVYCAASIGMTSYIKIEMGLRQWAIQQHQ